MSEPGLNDYIPVTQSTARTQIKVWKCCYRWTIENFNYCPRITGQFLESPSFEVGPNSEQKWRIELYPKGVSAEFDNYIALYLKLVHSIQSRTHANFEISLVNDEGKKVRTLYGGGVLSPFCRTGWKDFAKRDLLFRESADPLKIGNVSVHCELSASIETKSKADVDHIRMTMPRFKVPEKLLGLLERGEFTDVIITSRNKEFRAHAAILAANSQKFMSMLEGRETKLYNHVSMRSYDAEVVEELLRFMYAGRVPHFAGEMAEQLLAVSEEFGLMDLKAMAEEVLISRIRVETVSQVLLLSCQHNARRLKSFCLDFIRRNVGVVLDTDGWRAAAKERPRIVDEVANNLALCLARPQ